MMHSRFASRLATLLAGCVLLVAPGCMKGNENMVLNKDGSGTTTMKVVVDTGKMNEIMEMFKGMMSGGEGMGEGESPMKKEMEDKMSADELKKKLEGKKGVELISATPIDDAEKKLKGFEAKVKFASLEDFFRAGLDESIDVRLEDLGGGAWRLTRKNVMPGQGDSDEVPEEAAGQMEMVKGMLEPYVADLEMVVTIALPGTVTETNGTKNEAGTSVTWKMGFEDMLDAKKRQQVVTFKAEGLTLKPFHLRVDGEGKAEDVVAKPAEAPKEPAAPATPVAPK